MTIKVFISGISASQEVRKKQQRVLFIMESLKIDHEVVDITEPGKEEEKTLMRESCAKQEKTNSLPPQIFLDDEYLGDYNDFELATENDNLFGFLKISPNKTIEHFTSKSNGFENGDSAKKSVDVEATEEGEKEMEVNNGLLNGESDSNIEVVEESAVVSNEQELVETELVDTKVGGSSEVVVDEGSAKEDIVEEKEVAQSEEEEEEEED